MYLANKYLKFSFTSSQGMQIKVYNVDCWLGSGKNGTLILITNMQY